MTRKTKLRVVKDDPLTPRQRFFVLEYLKDRNATQAYIRAGYSAVDANVGASLLLANQKVADSVATGLARLALKVETKAEDVLRALKELSEYDPADAFDAEGRLLSIHDMPLDVRKALLSIESEELYGYELGQDGKVPIGKLRKAKFVSREKAVEMLGKFHKMLTDKVEHEHRVKIEVVDPYAVDPKKPEGGGTT